MATEPATEQPRLQGPAAWEQEAEREHVHGLGPWRLGLRRLRRNKVALAFGVLFVLLVARVPGRAAVGRARGRRRRPNENHLTDTIEVDGKKTRTSSRSTACRSGRTWQATASSSSAPTRNGRDIMVRLLYGGRNSLLIGIARRADHDDPVDRCSALLAGYFRGWSDAVISAAARHHVVVPGGAARRRARRGAGARRAASSGPINICGRLAADPDPDHRRSSTSRTWRGRSAARCCRCARRSSSRPRAPRARARCGSCSPRSCPTSPRRSLVFFTLLIANAILLEAALSFLGAGVRPPEPVVGHDDRRGRRPHRHRARTWRSCRA